MTTDPHTAAAAEAAATLQAMAEIEQLGRPGSTARLAVLQHMAKHPGGAEFEALHALISKALARTVTNRRTTQVLMAMRADGHLARERQPQGPGLPDVWRWYSPAARQAATVRGAWRPLSDHQADAAAHEAAGAIARARGLATDPNAD